MPHWNRLWNKYAHSFINASEEFVGLPKGQMGNSEVGHLNIGAGRVIQQDLEKLMQALHRVIFLRMQPSLTHFNYLKKTAKPYIF